MKSFFILLFFVVFIFSNSFGHEPREFVFYDIPKPELNSLLQKTPKWKLVALKKIFFKKNNPKLIATGLILLLGPFGAHRIYLGTRTQVPIFYTVTLGGGAGLLPFADLIAILSTKDMSKYFDNPKFIMWIQ
ncbi:MAG: TM2 domain-containing protein [Flavobacteriales bacterium]|nr:TM2 domain-containing protein [Flavobacteriales bacterium]